MDQEKLNSPKLFQEDQDQGKARSSTPRGRDYSSETLQQIILKALKCFGAGALAKFLFAMIQNRLRLLKVLKNSQPILRFALMTAGFSFLYKITRYLMERSDIKVGRDLQVFVASMVASLALHLADPKDMNLLKLLIFPRALESIWALLEEKGLVKPISNGSFYLNSFAVTLVVYFYVHEPFNLESSITRSVNSYVNMIPGEKHIWSAFTNIMLRNIKNSYPYTHNLG